MINEKYEPSKAEILAGIVTGDVDLTEGMATVQRSHRFPLHIFIQIENMARLGQVPISVIINQLVECGLDAVRQELPEDIAKQLNHASKEQIERPTKSVIVEVKGRNLAARNKAKGKK
ncbi:MAG: hypothetical protein ACLQHK_05905 [Gallionellaceae bacterium]